MDHSALARTDASSAADPRPAVIALIAAWADAWNAHDMAGAHTLLAPDIDFVTVAGLWLQGGAEFLSHHRAIHHGQMRQSEWTNLQHELRFVRADLCLVHLEWTIVGEREPNGTPRPRRYGVFTWLIERRERWLIVAV